MAFGGNALLPAEDDGTVAEQLRRAEEAADWLVEFAERGEDLLIVHGNGPQVGQVMIQMEEAATKIPPGTLDLAVAQTQGSLGYLLALALLNRLAQKGLEREVNTVLSLTAVDSTDPGFLEPTKPVGPYFSRYRARSLKRDHSWALRKDPAGRGYRKVVASPRPLEVFGLKTIRTLLANRGIVMAGGGGGVPVVRTEDGRLEGVEAVIDKDWTASLLARELGADLLAIVTNVAEVYRHFGAPEQQAIRRLDASEVASMLDDDAFPAGSMKPKMEAVLAFVRERGRPAVITDSDHLRATLDGKAGTTVVPDSPPMQGR